jgi:hypothetical protein
MTVASKRKRGRPVKRTPAPRVVNNHTPQITPITTGVRGASDASGLADRTIRKLCRDGVLDSLHVGNRLLIRVDSLQRLLRSRAEPIAG